MTDTFEDEKGRPVQSYVCTFCGTTVTSDTDDWEDHDFEGCGFQELHHTKFMAEGITDLAKVADAYEAWVLMLRARVAEGWILTQAVDNGYVFIGRPYKSH